MNILRRNLRFKKAARSCRRTDIASKLALRASSKVTSKCNVPCLIRTYVRPYRNVRQERCISKLFGKKPKLSKQARFATVKRYISYQLVGLTALETVFQSISGRLSERGRKKKENIDKRKNVQTTPIRTCCKRSRPLPYSNSNQ